MVVMLKLQLPGCNFSISSLTWIILMAANKNMSFNTHLKFLLTRGKNFRQLKQNTTYERPLNFLRWADNSTDTIFSSSILGCSLLPEVSSPHGPVNMGGNKQTYTHTLPYRLNWPSDRFSENKTIKIATRIYLSPPARKKQICRKKWAYMLFFINIM